MMAGVGGQARSPWGNGVDSEIQMNRDKAGKGREAAGEGGIERAQANSCRSESEEGIGTN